MKVWLARLAFNFLLSTLQTNHDLCVTWQFEVQFGALVVVVVSEPSQVASQLQGKMFIFVNVLSRSKSDSDDVAQDHSETKDICLEVTFGDRIESVKGKIQQLEPSLPTYKQLLLFAGQQLEDGHSLEEYGVEDQSTLFLVFKPTGKLNNLFIMN